MGFFSKKKQAKASDSQLQAQIIQPHRSLFSFMPVVEEITVQTKQEMLEDAVVGALLEQRMYKVSSKSYSVQGGNGSSAGVVEAALPVLARGFSHLANAVCDGYAVAEVVWKLEAGVWTVASLVPHTRDSVIYDDGVLYYYCNGVKEIAPQYKFILHRHAFSPEYPQGKGVLKRVYWAWKCKQMSWEFWLQLADRFGVPSVIALFDLETIDDEKAQKRADEISSAISNMSSSSSAALANIKDIKTLDAGGSVQDFDTLVNACNREISIAITGQTLANMEAEHGTRAQAEVHEHTFDELVTSDVMELQRTLNSTVISWLYELNYANMGTRDVPLLVFDTNVYASWEMVKDAIDRGVPVSKSALYGHYGLPEPTGDSDVFTGGSVGAGAGVEASDGEALEL